MIDSADKQIFDVTQLEQILQSARQQVEELEKKVQFAKDTSDVSKQADEAQKKARPVPLRQRVEAVLRSEPMNVYRLSKKLEVQHIQIRPIIEKLKTEGKVYNLGNEVHPVWTFVIGDSTSTPEVNAIVRRLVAERPMSLKELVEATGVRLSRISGAVIHLQRTEKKLYRMGPRRASKWFLVGENAELATLPPKGGSK